MFACQCFFVCLNAYISMWMSLLWVVRQKKKVERKKISTHWQIKKANTGSNDDNRNYIEPTIERVIYFDSMPEHALLTRHLKSRSTHFDCVYSLGNILFYAFEQVENTIFFIFFAWWLFSSWAMCVCVRECVGFFATLFFRLICPALICVCKWTFRTFRNAPKCARPIRRKLNRFNE